MEGPPRSSRDAPAEELLELLQLLRRELALRDESPTGAWVEETAGALRRGDQWGVYYPPAGGGGLAFRTERGADSFAHVHVGPSSGASDRALRLTETLLDGLPASVRSVTVGFTGLSHEDEARLEPALLARPGSTVIERFAMERALGSDDERPLPSLPPELTLVAVRDVSLDALADLDQRAFAGSIDELLIGPTVADSRRVVGAMLDGSTGRFLDEASTALYRADPPTLTGALLTTERTPQRALFVDFMVDPRERGHGYGLFLLRWGFRALRALGYSRVRLWVSSSNVPARRLYDRTGFAVTHATRIYRWDRPGSAAQAHSGR